MGNVSTPSLNFWVSPTHFVRVLSLEMFWASHWRFPSQHVPSYRPLLSDPGIFWHLSHVDGRAEGLLSLTNKKVEKPQSPCWDSEPKAPAPSAPIPIHRLFSQNIWAQSKPTGRKALRFEGKLNETLQDTRTSGLATTPRFAGSPLALLRAQASDLICYVPLEAAIWCLQWQRSPRGFEVLLQMFCIVSFHGKEGIIRTETRVNFSPKNFSFWFQPKMEGEVPHLLKLT